MNDSMFEKLVAIETRYDQLTTEISDPAVQADTAKFRAHSKTLAELQPTVDAFRQYKLLKEEIAATEALLKDPEMRELAQDDLPSLQNRLEQLDSELKVLLV